MQSLDRAVALLAATPEPVIRIAPQDATADLKRAFQLAANPRNWISDAQLQHMLATVVFSLAQSLTGPPEPADPVHRDIARTLAWIDTHLTEPIDATDLAAVSGLSTSRFCQAFGTVTGTSPKDYLLRRKTDYAR
ncbi:AraC family transcriptional regulator (plasmid) [Embleya sp. NBC_00888]|uniref:hypothetical protein n=1 Tax=Embleya sp. NBC_00888 TaxID=2975960 RepID=UPI00386CA876|nr:AraC family transcriptional regulator [Embleya sp. NBC_00888]